MKKNYSTFAFEKGILMHLIVDVGNTRVKAAVFERDTMLGRFVFLATELPKTIRQILGSYPTIHTLVVATVGNTTLVDFESFSSAVTVVQVDRKWTFPFVNQYKTPHTLGIDRMVLAAGAVLLFPQKNRLVIDAGSCITYDYITEDNVYLGGSISPGIQMRYQALHNYTASLPLLEPTLPKSVIGDSTIEAIHSGVLAGILYEIEGLIQEFEKQNANFIIILTGGDTDFLANQLKNTIFAHSNFLLESLNLLYQYQQNDKKTDYLP